MTSLTSLSVGNCGDPSRGAFGGRTPRCLQEKIESGLRTRTRFRCIASHSSYSTWHSYFNFVSEFCLGSAALLVFEALEDGTIVPVTEEQLPALQELWDTQGHRSHWKCMERQWKRDAKRLEPSWLRAGWVSLSCFLFGVQSALTIYRLSTVLWGWIPLNTFSWKSGFSNRPSPRFAKEKEEGQKLLGKPVVQPVPEGQSMVEFVCFTVSRSNSFWHVLLLWWFFFAGEEGEPKTVLESFRVGVPGEGPTTCQCVEATDGWQHRLGLGVVFAAPTRFLFLTFGHHVEVKRTWRARMTREPVSDRYHASLWFRISGSFLFCVFSLRPSLRDSESLLGKCVARRHKLQRRSRGCRCWSPEGPLLVLSGFFQAMLQYVSYWYWILHWYLILDSTWPYYEFPGAISEPFYFEWLFSSSSFRIAFLLCFCRLSSSVLCFVWMQCIGRSCLYSVSRTNLKLMKLKTMIRRTWTFRLARKVKLPEDGFWLQSLSRFFQRSPIRVFFSPARAGIVVTLFCRCGPQVTWEFVGYFVFWKRWSCRSFSEVTDSTLFPTLACCMTLFGKSSFATQDIAAFGMWYQHIHSHRRDSLHLVLFPYLWTSVSPMPRFNWRLWLGNW